MATLLQAQGWELDTGHVDVDGHGYKFVRDGLEFDVIAPEGMGGRADVTTVPPLRAPQLAGTRQALDRTFARRRRPRRSHLGASPSQPAGRASGQGVCRGRRPCSGTPASPRGPRAAPPTRRRSRSALPDRQGPQAAARHSRAHLGGAGRPRRAGCRPSSPSTAHHPASLKRAAAWRAGNRTQGRRGPASVRQLPGTADGRRADVLVDVRDRGGGPRVADRHPWPRCCGAGSTESHGRGLRLVDGWVSSSTPPPASTATDVTWPSTSSPPPDLARSSKSRPPRSVHYSSEPPPWRLRAPRNSYEQRCAGLFADAVDERLIARSPVPASSGRAHQEVHTG
jgi:hypothetical protein